MKRTLLQLSALACLLAPTAATAQQLTGIWVGNQGNFAESNGSVTFYDPATGEASPALENFGTLVQSLTLHDGRIYVLSNTSGAVDILDAATRERVGQIREVSSPRYMSVAAEGKAYISNLYDSTITVVDLAAEVVTGTLRVGTNPEDIAVVAGRAYVANYGFGGDSTLSVIDTAADTLLATLDMGCDGPRHLEVDPEEEVWVFCRGNTVYNADFTEILTRTNASVVVLDGATGEIITRIGLDSQTGAAALGQDTFLSIATEEAFLLHGKDVLIFSTATNELVTTYSLGGDEDVGGLAYDPATEQIYAARIIDYETPGFVSIHGRLGGPILDRFPAGIAPAHITVQTAREIVDAKESVEPRAFTLGANYPNPFRRSTAVPFSLRASGHVRLTIYDVLGRVVATPLDDALGAGDHVIEWHANQSGSGVYFARLQNGGQVSMRRLVRMD